MAIDKMPLLDELEALQATLQNTAGIDLHNIPLLDDIIDDSPLSASETATIVQNKPHYDADQDFQHELFIQEFIDSMMPNIEAELRTRLLSLDKSILEQWHRQTHD
ncbi:MAG: hypothetical protein ACI9BO_000455 [Zhongshania sp.]|jgi:hypothetical protein